MRFGIQCILYVHRKNIARCCCCQLLLLLLIAKVSFSHSVSNQPREGIELSRQLKMIYVHKLNAKIAKT